MRASIRDVAEHAGVSPVTVSNVLRGRTGRASMATRSRVLKAAKTLRYAPVAGPATQKRHVETRVIGLIFDGAPLEGLWGMPAFWGMREAAVERDYDLLTMLRVRPDWMLDQEELQFLDRRSDGFIFIAPYNRYQMLEVLVSHQLPSVACFTTDVPESVPVIVLDDFGAMQQSVQHLIAHGHQRILHLTTDFKRSDFAERQRGYEQTMRQAGLQPVVLADETLKTTNSADTFLRTIRQHRITAVACSSDGWAAYVLKVAQANGIRIPEDLSVVGMDDVAESEKYGLTSIRFSCEEMGRRAMEVIVDLIQGGDGKSVNRVIPVKLVERSSVATL